MPSRARAAAIVPCLLLFLLGGCLGPSRNEQYRSVDSSAVPPQATPEKPSGGESFERVGGERVHPPGGRDLGSGADEEKLPPPERRGNPTIGRDGFSDATDSTFAIDVDNASWIGLRRTLRTRQDVDPQAVRVEEVVNAFAYHYAPPPDDDALTADASVVRCPWNADRLLLRIGIQAKVVSDAERPASNLVLLVDTSGSMEPAQRLPLLRTAFHRLAARLDGRDRIAIVAYAGNARVVLEPTAGSDHQRIDAAIDRMGASGSTNGDAGIRTAYELSRRQFIQGGQNRVILATDGDFNVGMTSERDLVRLVRSEARGGILLNVIGVGDSADGDARMEAVADHGDGVYTALDDSRDVDRLLAGPLGGQLATVARDAKVQLWINPESVKRWRLIGYENRLLARSGFNDDAVDGGEVGAGHQATALYEIIPQDDRNPFVGSETLCRVRLRWQPPGGGASVLREVDVLDRPGALDRDTGWAAAVAAIALKIPQDHAVARWTWSAAFALADEYADDTERKEAVRLLRRLHP